MGHRAKTYGKFIAFAKVKSGIAHVSLSGWAYKFQLFYAEHEQNLEIHF